jgi:hypothetical protein
MAQIWDYLGELWAIKNRPSGEISTNLVTLALLGILGVGSTVEGIFQFYFCNIVVDACIHRVLKTHTHTLQTIDIYGANVNRKVPKSAEILPKQSLFCFLEISVGDILQ